MLLRTRITAMVATGLLLTALALLGGGWLHEQLLLQRISESALQADRALWAGALAQQDQALDEASDKLQLDAAFLAAVRRSDSAVLTQLLAQRGLFDEGLDDGLQRRVAALQGLGSAPLVWGVAAELPLLDSDSLERASAGDALSGLRLVGGRQALVLSTRRLPLPGAPVVLVLGRHARHALERFAERTATSASVLDLRGALSASTDDALWHRFSSARTTYTRRRKAQFAEQAEKREGARQLKEQIIAEARPLAESTDWGPTAGAFRDLMTRWKAAGASSGIGVFAGLLGVGPGKCLGLGL